jgi:hypothetical protein
MTHSCQFYTTSVDVVFFLGLSQIVKLGRREDRQSALLTALGGHERRDLADEQSTNVFSINRNCKKARAGRETDAQAEIREQS